LGDDIVKADKPVTKQLIETFNEKQSTVIGVQKVPDDLVPKYGIVDYSNGNNGDYQVKDLIEKPDLEDAPSNIAILGRYIITPAIFDILKNTDPGKGGEIQLTDALKSLLTQEDVYAHIFNGRRYDIGNKQGFLEAVVEFAFAREDIRDDFKEYLLSYLQKELKNDLYQEVASASERR
jgi:UTP--glucose-1-phosphate uridylyltransferase